MFEVEALFFVCVNSIRSDLAAGCLRVGMPSSEEAEELSSESSWSDDDSGNGTLAGEILDLTEDFFRG